MNEYLFLRVAQVAESIFALLALFFVFGLPWPPTGYFLIPWIYWSALAAGAAWVAYHLRRPTRRDLLAAYTIIIVVFCVSLLRSVVISEYYPPSADAAMIRGVKLLAALTWLTQLVVLVCLLMARRLLTRKDASGIVPPVA